MSSIAQVKGDTDVDHSTGDVEHPSTATSKKKIKLDKAEKLLAKAMAMHRAEEQQNGISPQCLELARKYAGQAKKGAVELSNLLHRHSKSLSDDMSRDVLVSRLIPEQKRELFNLKEEVYYNHQMGITASGAASRNEAGLADGVASPSSALPSEGTPMPPTASACADTIQETIIDVSPTLMTRKSSKSADDTAEDSVSVGPQSLGHVGTKGATFTAMQSLQESPIAVDLPIGPPIQQILPCRARYIPSGHTDETAFLTVPPNALHGLELSCSHKKCDKFFRYCAVCDTVAAKVKFDERHGHGYTSSSLDIEPLETMQGDEGVAVDSIPSNEPGSSVGKSGGYSQAVLDLARLSAESLLNGRKIRDWEYIERYKTPALHKLLESVHENYRHVVRTLIGHESVSRRAYNKLEEATTNRLKNDAQYAAGVLEQHKVLCYTSHLITPDKRKASPPRRASKARRTLSFSASPSNVSNAELNDQEEEIIQLMEESKLARGDRASLVTDWKYVSMYASVELSSHIALNDGGPNKKSRLLRGFNGNSSLKAITEQRQDLVRKRLQLGQIDWLGNPNHYHSCSDLSRSSRSKHKSMDESSKASHETLRSSSNTHNEGFNGHESDVDGAPMSVNGEEMGDKDSNLSDFDHNNDEILDGALTPHQQELARLCAESGFLGNPSEKKKRNWTYIEYHASPSLRLILESKGAKSREIRAIITSKFGREAFAKEEDYVLQEIRQDDNYIAKVRLKHHAISLADSKNRLESQHHFDAINESTTSRRGKTSYDSEFDEYQSCIGSDDGSEIDEGVVALTDAEKDLAILAQESMYSREAGKCNFQYVECFASQQLKQHIRNQKPQYRHTLVVLVKSGKKNAFNRLKRRTRRKLMRDSQYAKQIRERLKEALGESKAATIISGSFRNVSTPVATPSPKRRPPTSQQATFTRRPVFSSTRVPEQETTTHSLTKYEKEIIQLGEESRIAYNDSKTYRWDYITAYASRELADWMDKTRVLTTSGGSKLARALRGYRCNPNPSLRRITEKRQQDVHRSLKEEHLQWFGNRDHYKSKRVTSRRTNYTNANVNANAHTRMEDSGVGSPPLDKYEEEAMRLGELSKVHSKKFTAKKGLYDWDYIRDHASDGLKAEMIRREVYRIPGGKIERMFPFYKRKDLKSHFQKKQKEMSRTLNLVAEQNTISATSARAQRESVDRSISVDCMNFAAGISTQSSSSRHTHTPSSFHGHRRRRNARTNLFEEPSFIVAKSDLFDKQDDGTRDLGPFTEETIRLGEKSSLLAPLDDVDRPNDEYDFDYIWQNRRGIIQEEIDKWDIVDANDLVDHFVAECEGIGLRCQRSAKEARKSLVPSSNIKEAKLHCGDRVFAMYPGNGCYYPGMVVRVYGVVEDEKKECDDCLYKVRWDDGDEIEKSEEHYVLPEQDYKIWTERWSSSHEDYDEQKKAKGIQSYVDRSSDATDWNAKRGWWETDLTGDVRYSSIVSAMRAYDDYYVRGHGEATRKKDLNIPEEWTFPASPGLPPTPKQSREYDKSKRNPVRNIIKVCDSSRNGSISPSVDSNAANEVSEYLSGSSSSSSSERARSICSASGDDYSDSAAAFNTVNRLHIMNELSKMKKAAAEEKARYARILGLMDDALPADSMASIAYKRMIEGEKLNMDTMCKANAAREERLEQLLRTVDEANEPSSA